MRRRYALVCTDPERDLWTALPGDEPIGPSPPYFMEMRWGEMEPPIEGERTRAWIVQWVNREVLEAGGWVDLCLPLVEAARIDERAARRYVLVDV
jgi:hypothetical protein